MKIKTTLLAITIIAGTLLPSQADPIGFVRDVFYALGNNIGKPPFHGSSTTISYYGGGGGGRGGSYYSPSCNRDTFHRPVTYYDGYEYSRGQPPPQAYAKVRYPGKAPKYLYNDKSILVQCHGDSYSIIYRRQGW
jgi:hypothetical protein